MTNLDTLLEKPEMMRSWLESPATKRFFEFLMAEREMSIGRVRDVVGLQETGVAQGDLKRIDKILALKKAIMDRGPRVVVK